MKDSKKPYIDLDYSNVPERLRPREGLSEKEPEHPTAYGAEHCFHLKEMMQSIKPDLKRGREPLTPDTPYYHILSGAGGPHDTAYASFKRGGKVIDAEIVQASSPKRLASTLALTIVPTSSS